MPHRNPPPIKRAADDHELVALCEAYVRAVAATNAAADVSPLAPGCAAAMRGQDRLIAKEARLERRIAARRAYTPEGILAKARAAKAWHEAGEDGEDRCALARSLVADLVRHGGGHALLG